MKRTKDYTSDAVEASCQAAMTAVKGVTIAEIASIDM